MIRKPRLFTPGLPASLRPVVREALGRPAGPGAGATAAPREYRPPAGQAAALVAEEVTR